MKFKWEYVPIPTLGCWERHCRKDMIDYWIFGNENDTCSVAYGAGTGLHIVDKEYNSIEGAQGWIRRNHDKLYSEYVGEIDFVFSLEGIEITDPSKYSKRKDN